MSFKFYLYEMGTIDFYQGMTRLSDYIRLCDEKLNSYDYPNYLELKKFLIICFMEIKTSTIQWEGDIRESNEIFISGIPRLDCKQPHKLIVFKQDNGGQSFMVSECKMNFYNDNKELLVSTISLKDVDKRDIINSFHESYDLVEELFSKNSNKNIIENPIEHFKNIKMEWNGSNIEMIKLDENNTNDNKFDKSNYIQL